MPFFHNLLKLFTQAEMIRDHYTGISIEKILGLIKNNTEEELRFYVDGTANFGHQATTINLMKRLINKTKYKGAVKIIYNNIDPDTQDTAGTPQKLAILLTGLNPEQIDTTTITYETCLHISFLDYNNISSLTKEITFGFTGGADDMKINYATELKTKYFLRLQPYLWDDSMEDKEEKYFETSRVEQLNDKFFYLPEAYKDFISLAYKFPKDKFTTVDANVWMWYTENQTFDATLKLRTKNIKAIYDGYQVNKELHLWPLYGLHQFTTPDQLSTMFMNFVLSAFEAQKTLKKPIVIFSMNKITDIYSEFDAYIPSFANDINKKNSGLENFKNALEKQFDSQVKNNTCSKNSLETFVTQLSLDIQPLLKQDSKLTVFIGDQDIYDKFRDAIINATENEVIIALIGPVPVDIYNYFYANCNIPGVFEGQGTSSLVISLGKPFLQLTREDSNIENNYPSTLTSKNYSSISNNANEAALQLRDQQYENYLLENSPINTKEYYNNIQTIATFITKSLDSSSDIYKYFTAIGNYYQKDIHDKFMLGLVAVDALMLGFERQIPLIFEQLANTDLLDLREDSKLTLDDVYNQLIQNWNNGGVSLKDALPQTYLSNFFYQVTNNTFFITVDQDNIKAEKDGDAITKVTLSSATTKAFESIDISVLDVSLTFTADDGSVVTQVQGFVNQTWQIEGIPWIGFENSGFIMKVNEGGIPVQGGLTGTVKGADLALQIVYPTVDNTWLIQGTFQSNYPSIDTFYQMAGGIALTQVLPFPLSELSGFGLKNVQLMYSQSALQFDYMAFEITTQSPWTISQTPLFQIKPTVTVIIYNVQDVANRQTKFLVTGAFKVGDGTITVNGGFPNFELYGGLSSGTIMLSDLLSLFGGELDLTTSVTQLSFAYKPEQTYYQIGASLEDDKPLNILGLFTINNLSFNVTSRNGANTAILGGAFTLLPDTEKINISIQAQYGTNAGWAFKGLQTSGQVSLLDLFTGYLPNDWKPSNGVHGTFDVKIDRLSINIETKTCSWEFTGKTATPIAIPGTGININLNLKMGYNGGTSTMGGRETIVGVAEVPVLASDGKIVPLIYLLVEAAPETGYFGTVSAEITWEFIDITVFYDFKPDYKAFGIKWGILEGQITTKNGETSATLNFTQSTTLGSMVETMVGWATGSKFSLSSPWNILDSIPLNNLSLIYNFTKKQVSFNVDIGPIEMGFARLDSINIAYKSNQPNPDDNGVIVEIVGQFRWQDEPKTPLSWDASKPETTPSPEGQGNKYLDLRLLALGQHVTLPCFADANTVQEAIACMKQLPEPDKDNIMIPPVTLDANSSWLIGMEFGILRFGGDKKANGNGGESADSTALVLAGQDEAAPTGYFITMQIVFNDPNLYALRIALDGDAAKVLKGLDFQILYKKIGDNLGLYKAEIALPDKMRFIRMGQYNINLPVFGIEYYTNGDFQVDFGFPWKADFSRSLTFQTLIWTPVPIPVMGSLGVYFGKLSSATTNKVPKIDNGTFNPVLVFGFGIQFGLGYTFEVGILKAGFSLTAVAILEGVIAKFNAYQLTDGSGNIDQVDSSYYFWIKGTVGIIGKLFGSVDFAIIKADVNIDIRILASFTFAPYEPIELNLMASVDIEVSIKINLGLFKIKISFSFSAKISQTITIKASGDNSPWHIAPGETAFFMALRRKRKRGFPERQQMLLAIAASTPLNWRNLNSSETPAMLQGYMTLGLTMAGDTATQLSEQVACYVAMMFIDSMAPPREDATSGIAKAYSDSADTSFEVLAKTILRWAVAALQPAPVTPQEVDSIIVTDIQLQYLLDALKEPDQPTPIPSGDIENFMTGQFNFRVEGPTSSKEPNATYFPVPPSMKLSLPQYGSDYDALSYTFGEYNKTSSDYLAYLRDYFNQLAVKVQEENNNTVSTFALNDSNSESLSSFIFSDYFLMICRQMLQSALDSLREFKYFLQDGNTPNNIVKWINTNTALSGDSAYSLEELFTDNAGVALNADKSLVIQGVTYVVQANDTFDSIAANSLFSSGFDGAALATLNADTNNTLRAGIAINYPGKPPYTTQPGQSLKTVAEAIGGIDVAHLIQHGDITSVPNLPLPVASYKIPNFTYKTVDEDTLRSVAAKFRIDQKHLAAPDANGEVIDLFFKSSTNPTTLDIANLTQFKVGELLKEIQASQGLQHLSGMVSRYYLAGLRLPTNGITPEKKGMWVTGDSPDNYKLPDFAGLYALTGQQFPIPNLNNKDDFNVNFENGGLGWLNFANEEPTKLEISIKPNTNDTAQINLVKGFATTTKLDTRLTYLGLGGMFNTKEATYTFNNEIAWSAVSSFNMPYGGKPPGIPTMQLWRLPDSLLNLPDPSTRKVNPRMAMKVGEYSEAAGAMVERGLNYYGYASLIEFTVKKVPAIEASPSTKTTYEIIGADGSSAKVLERIVSEIGNNDEAIQILILAYATDPNSTTSQGIQTDNASSVTLGLVQVNLSTETRPDSALSAEMLLTESGAEDMTLLNTKTDFIRLLWEASITRAGGYFLYYFNQDTPGGLPDRVFNDKQEALLSLIVVYSQPADTTLQNTIGNYINALVTGEAIERSNTVLFAESNPNPNLTIPSTATQTLAEIAYSYFGNVSQVAADNADLQLRPGIELVVSEGTYVVGPDAPGGDLQAISKYFGTTQEAIKSANPKIATWANTLAQYTVLYLPLLTLKIGINQGGNTLGGLAKYYGMNLTALANRNKDVAGIFADGQAVKISGGPAITTSTVPAGNVTVEAIRPVPLALPDTPTGNDYGKIFLLNMYSLLSYKVTGNLYFKESQLGLPASPTAKPEDSNNFSKIRVPQMLAEGDDWLFRFAVPYNQFSLQTLSAQSDLPDPNNSPYKGLGDLLQVDFAWQDLYGNRLLTNLSNPSANDKTPLNKSPILTGYNDAIIGLKQWPSVTSTYEVVNHSGKPTINLSLTFDGSVYQGLISAEVKSANTIHAVFTEALDQTSAETKENYTLDNGIKIQSVVLADNLTVALTVDQIPPSFELALSVANISNAGKTQTFQGLAKFYNPQTAGESTSTLLQKAKGDLQTFTLIWYQMTDPYGIRYTVTTSLVESDYILDSTQVSGLVQTWLASIWQFVNDRACGHTTVPLPATSHLLSFPINEASLNRKEIYKLDLSFAIERTGGAVMGDLETTSGIKSVSTDITPYPGAGNKTTSSLKTFAQNFETALEKTGVYALKIATGIDRKESLSSKGGNELWVVRLGLDQQTSIAYQIDKKDPLLFAPRPVSTKLENRDQVDIYDFDPSKGIDFNTPSRHLNFTNIDMDLWTEQFFSAVDGMLSPEFTAAIELVDHYQNKTCLQTMLNNKKALAGIVKEWMIFVFDSENGSTSEIQEAFYQQLLVKLSNAYTVKAGVQYSAKVEAGDFKLFFVSLGDDNNLVLLFTSDIDQNTAENTKNYSISGGLVVSSATFNAQNAQIVTLKIGGGVPVVGETLVTIASGYQDAQGITIAGSLIMRVQSGSAATPELYGNIALKQTVETVVDVSYQTRNLSITSAKLNLKNSKAVPLPFLISAPQLVRNDAGAILPYIDLDTTYVSNEIEQQIEALPNIPDYRASTWLSFLNGSNLLNAELGVTKVPMILRSFPASPMMVKQQGEASNLISGSDISKILEWNYTINYSQTFHYPQDELNFTVNFNVYDDATVLANFKDVFNTLAEFITVYPEVEKVFREKLVGIDATTADPDKFNAAAIALDAFNGMVDKIVAVAKITGLHASNFSPSRLTLAVDPYNFSVKEGSGTVGTETAALLVTIIGKPPAGIGTPTVTIPGYTTKTYTETCNGDFCFYFQDPGGNPLKALTGQGIGSRTVTLPKMNILARQDAETTVELKRNIDLVPSKTTASDFIYTTGKVGFANRYYPLIEYDQEISIAAIGSGEPQNATLSQHLTNLFNELLKENSQDALSFLMTNTYTYQLNPALDRIELPGIMQPMQGFNVKGSSGRDDDKTLTKMIESWSGSIQKWFNTHKTSIEDGILHFDLTIFSNLTQQPLPLVRLKSLTLELKYVIDIPQKIVTIEQQDSIYCGKWLFIFRPLKLWQYFKWAKWGENNALWFAIQSPYMTIVFAKGDIGDPLIFFYPFPH